MLHDITEADTTSHAEYGGKAALLGMLARAGFPVPQAFVIPSSVFGAFLQSNDLTGKINSAIAEYQEAESPDFEAVAIKIREFIVNAEMPPSLQKSIERKFENLQASRVAVRSSAAAEDSRNASWAGQFDTYLNASKADLLRNIQLCWSSRFSARALHYQSKMKLSSNDFSVAVIVQEMVQSEKSGVAFSVHPITSDPKQIYIEAAAGLGDSLVSGEINPDQFVVEKATGRNFGSPKYQQPSKHLSTVSSNSEDNASSQKTSHEPILSKNEIANVARLTQLVENKLGFPCDVEWALVGSVVFLLQARPITIDPSKVAALFANLSQYRRSFWARGVSVLVTDLHLAGYSKMEVLYTIDEGLFEQYFTRAAVEISLKMGLEFYKSSTAFSTYMNELDNLCADIDDFHLNKIAQKKVDTKNDVEIIFGLLRNLCEKYATMNTEVTDLACQMQETDEKIKHNLSLLTNFKDRARAFLNRALFVDDGPLMTLAKSLSRQFSLSPDILHNLTQREVLALFDGKFPDLGRIADRQNAFALSYHSNEPIEGEQARDLLARIQSRNVSRTGITGVPASPGIARGPVRVIAVDYGDLDGIAQEIERMSQGDILVAETTAPELVKACEKASAIVTDVGGLLSHAAIVSRELKIPCIVGTQDASRRLRDGEMVEVNAHTGIVSKAVANQ